MAYSRNDAKAPSVHSRVVHSTNAARTGSFLGKRSKPKPTMSPFWRDLNCETTRANCSSCHAMSGSSSPSYAYRYPR